MTTTLLTSDRMSAFAADLGDPEVANWKLEDLLTSIRLSEPGTFTMPEGWAFGPKSQHFVLTGTWPEATKKAAPKRRRRRSRKS